MFKMSDLSVKQKVFLMESFYGRKKSFAAAIKAFHTEWEKSI